VGHGNVADLAFSGRSIHIGESAGVGFQPWCMSVAM
jgi:hypothetical protein